jgi:PAS domain S-box-containing protein
LEQLAIDLEELVVAKDELVRQTEQLAEAQRTIARERQRYQELFDLAPDAYLVTTHAGVIEETNRAAATLLGCEQAFLCTKPLAVFIAPESLQEFRRLLWQLRDGRSVCGWELRMQRMDRTTFQAALDVTSMDSEGRPDGYPVGFRWIIRDISEQKRSQALLENVRDGLERQARERTAELEATNEVLHAQKRLLEAILYQAAEAVIACDRDGKLTLVNEAARRLALMDPEGTRLDIAPEVWGEAFDTDGCPIPTEERPLAKALRGEPTTHREAHVVRPDGSTYDLQISASPLQDAEGGIIGAVAILADNTEYKEAERRKREFLSIASHELRTPLTSLLGSLGLVQGGVVGELPSQAKQMIAIAHRNAERLVRLINNLLDLDKIESGKMPFSPQPLDLTALVEEALAINRPYAEQFGVRLALQHSLPEVKVYADPDRLMQVLTNLLSNAAKFSPPGETVSVRLMHTRGRIRVEVADHGPGIPEAFRGHLFQKFAQAYPSNGQTKGGTGLGLSISKAIVERLGGHIGCDSAIHQGSTFYFELPEWREASPEDLPEDLPKDLLSNPLPPLTAVPAADIMVEESEHWTLFTGTPEALIAAGVAREDMFPTWPKRSGWHLGHDIPAEEQWTLTRIRGGCFRLKRYHAPHCPVPAYDPRAFRNGILQAVRDLERALMHWISGDTERERYGRAIHAMTDADRKRLREALEAVFATVREARVRPSLAVVQGGMGSSAQHGD